jgi:endonuclease YncB( thermonuclease family)
MAVKSLKFGRRLALVPIAFCLLAASSGADENELIAARMAPAKWETLKNCRLVADRYRDGDSFHAMYGGKEFVFRLYFVDAPETGGDQTDRTREQQKHFGLTLAELRRAGDAARQFTAAQLRGSFVVVTRWQNAGGRGRLPRFYAFVTVNGIDLGELLVSRGLSRAFGEDAILPSGVRAKDHKAKLRRLEREARASGLGAWETSINRRR